MGKINNFMEKEERSIFKILRLALYALAACPVVSIVGLLVVTLFGALDNEITKIQSAGDWWLILIVAYPISLIYVFYEPKVRLNLKRKRVVDGLILYWEEQLQKQDILPKNYFAKEYIRENLLERLKIWAWFDPNLWTNYFPDEKYSEYLFGMVDNYMLHLQNLIKKYGKNKSEQQI